MQNNVIIRDIDNEVIGVWRHLELKLLELGVLERWKSTGRRELMDGPHSRENNKRVCSSDVISTVWSTAFNLIASLFAKDVGKIRTELFPFYVMPHGAQRRLIPYKKLHFQSACVKRQQYLLHCTWH